MEEPLRGTKLTILYGVASIHMMRSVGFCETKQDFKKYLALLYISLFRND